MMKDIPYNINIMDERGIIIGSGERERIGTVHQGAYTQKIKKEAAQYHIDLTSTVYVRHLPAGPAHLAKLSNLFIQYPSFHMEEDSYLILIHCFRVISRVFTSLAAR